MGMQKDGPVITDQGFWVIDAHFEGIDAPDELDRALLATPGVLDHGLFLGLATGALIGQPDGTVEHLTPRRAG
jgi:ribose 5-phosphate isomerase A